MVSSIRTARYGLAMMILVLAAIPALAAEGRIPIPFTSPVVTPISITAPGKYILTRPLKATGGGPILDISVGAGIGLSEVDIDLNGFTLDATPFAGTFGIRATSVPGSSVEVSIRNGSIQGGTNAILVAPGGMAAVRKVVIEGVRASNTNGDAFVLGDAQNIVIRNCVIVDVTPAAGGVGAAIQIPVGSGVVRQATIEGNLIRNTKDAIIVMSAAAAPSTVAILNNRIESIVAGGFWGGEAIHLDNSLGSLISENTIRAIASSGIRLNTGDGCKIFDNVVDTLTNSGIVLQGDSDDNLVYRNVVTRAGASALFVGGDRNQIEANVLNSSGRGLTFDLTGAVAAGNVYRGNTARGNTGAAFCPAAVCSADFCGFAVASNQTQGDNWLPATVAAPPACEK